MSNDRVLLIHGIWNHRTWLQLLAGRLRGMGFATRLLSYDSILGGPVAALPGLLEAIQDYRPTYLVGHSLGGLMAMETLRWAPGLPVQRVACLGSPLRGSFTARHMAARPLMRHALGRSVELLTNGVPAWTGAAQVGMVAGTVPRGMGRMLARLEGPNDGSVLVSETQLDGLAAHCTVACGHTELALAEEPAKRVAQFLRTGTFGPGA